MLGIETMHIVLLHNKICGGILAILFHNMICGGIFGKHSIILVCLVAARKELKLSRMGVAKASLMLNGRGLWRGMRLEQHVIEALEKNYKLEEWILEY